SRHRQRPWLRSGRRLPDRRLKLDDVVQHLRLDDLIGGCPGEGIADASRHARVDEGLAADKQLAGRRHRAAQYPGIQEAAEAESSLRRKASRQDDVVDRNLFLVLPVADEAEAARDPEGVVARTAEQVVVGGGWRERIGDEAAARHDQKVVVGTAEQLIVEAAP